MAAFRVVVETRDLRSGKHCISVQLNRFWAGEIIVGSESFTDVQSFELKADVDSGVGSITIHRVVFQESAEPWMKRC